jgi:hypothetical protein
MLVFSDLVPGTAGPRRVARQEIRDSFTDGWDVESVELSNIQTTGIDVAAWLARIRRR